MNVISQTPNDYAPTRHYLQRQILTFKPREHASDEFRERDSLKSPGISPITWAAIGTAVWIGAVIGGWLLGYWLAR